VTKLHWPLSGKKPNVPRLIADKKIDWSSIFQKNYQEEELTNDYIIRRKAIDFAIPLFTNLQLARRFVEAINDWVSKTCRSKAGGSTNDRAHIANVCLLTVAREVGDTQLQKLTELAQ
jgi:hypothetical protein